MGSAWKFARVVAALGGGLFAVACGRVLGDIVVEDAPLVSGVQDPGPPGPADSGEEPEELPPACDPGRVRCNAAALQACVDDGSQWVTLQVCKSTALCDREGADCLPPVCGINELRCQGATLEKCRPGRDDWELVEVCPSAAHCNTAQRRCTVDPCQSGEGQCSGGQLQVCTPAGWQAQRQCGTQALCEVGLASCSALGAPCDPSTAACGEPVCLAGEVRCSGSRLEECNSEQTGWELLQQCASEALCLASGATCLPPQCAIGENRCAPDGVRQVCAPGRNGFIGIEQCLSSAFCSAEPGFEGCGIVPCEAGALRCNGAQPERCRDDRSGFEPAGAPCAIASLCSVEGGAASCAPAACEANAYQCAGAQLQRCNEDRTGFVTEATCRAPQLCNAAERRCLPAQCEPGEFRCQGGQLQSCSPGLSGFVDEQNCGAAGLCDSVAGTCSAELCTAGTRRCNGLALEECRDPAVGWEPIAICASNALCDAVGGRCQQAVCAADEMRCQGQALERCAAGLQRFEPVEQCAAGQICDATGGQCDLCEPESFRCVGDTLQQCSADGQAFQPAQTCGAGLCEASDGNPRCLRCTPNTARCAGASLIVCNQNGEELPAVACATAAQCVVQANLAQCLEPVCALGDIQCSPSGEVLSCNATRTGFASQSPPVVCAQPELCDAAVVGGCRPAPGNPPDVVERPQAPSLPPYDFQQLLNQPAAPVLGLGPLIVEAPVQWGDVDGTPWLDNEGQTIGPAVRSAPNNAAFNAGFDTPGFFMGATNLVGADEERLLDGLAALGSQCTRESRSSFEKPGYTGRFDVWRRCGGTETTTVALVAVPPARDYVVFIFAKLVADRDQAALDRIWASFQVVIP